VSRPVLAAALALAVSLASPAALAQPASSDGEAQRAELFRQGTVLAEHGRWQEAADKFREVIALRSAPKALIALAIAEERQGKLISARVTYEKAAADARAAGLADEQARAQSGQDSLQKRIPTIAIRAPASAQSVRVWVDDAPVAVPEKGPIEVRVDPGAHAVRVEAANHDPFRTTVRIAEAERTEVDARLHARASGGAPPPRSSSALPTGAALVGGAGLLTMGVSFILWAAGRGQEQDIIAQCPRGGTANDCPPELKDEADAAAAMIIAGNIVFPVGLLGVAVGGAWWLVSASSTPEPKKSGWVTVGPGTISAGGRF